jgi:tRNA threonylcarbamoyladenosine biosynthesis protein TsaB
MTRGQAEAMMPMIEEVFGESGTTIADMDMIVVTVGPGAFTGLRIAIATALGLSIASGVGVAGVSTTEAIVYGARLENSDIGDVIVALDSKRDDLYVQAFSEKGVAYGPVEAIGSQHINQWVSRLVPDISFTLIGDAAKRAQSLLDGSHTVSRLGDSTVMPDARYVADLAIEKLTAGLPLLTAKPLYLRPPDAVIPVNGGRLRP